MTDWSAKMADRLRKRGERQAVQDMKFVEIQRMKREGGPRLWDAVKSDLRAEGRALNIELGRELITEGKGTSDEFIVVANLDSEIREARILFSVETGKLAYTTGQGRNDIFELSVGQDGKMSFYSGMVPYGTGSIA